MAQLEEGQATSLPKQSDKAVRILAKSIFRELKVNGYDARQIVALSTELIGLLTTEIRPLQATDELDAAPGIAPTVVKSARATKPRLVSAAK